MVKTNIRPFRSSMGTLSNYIISPYTAKWKGNQNLNDLTKNKTNTKTNTKALNSETGQQIHITMSSSFPVHWYWIVG